jgi:hypothetical protein
MRSASPIAAYPLSPLGREGLAGGFSPHRASSAQFLGQSMVEPRKQPLRLSVFNALGLGRCTQSPIPGRNHLVPRHLQHRLNSTFAVRPSQ